MRTITLGYDDGPAARTALDWAARRAARDGSELHITTVTSLIGADARRVDRMLEDASRRVHDIAPGVHVELHRIDGSMPKALAEDARSADLVVVGIRRGSPVKAVLASKPLRLIARAHGPVAFIPEDWAPNDEPVTVGIDDDASSQSAILLAAAEADAAGAPLRVVHAWSMPVPTLEGSVALLSSPLQVKDQHRRILKDAVQRARAAASGLRIEDVLVSSAPTPALAHQAPRSSLLVLGTHRRGVVTGGLLGSVAQDLLGRVSTPVLIAPNPR
ncbi:universal stress protein [Microbacterium aurantiacum]|uniref:Universal stress protein n=1 Tax=Microbacterium aurantiacum TaxID=162393 RepID=A0ABT8FNN3_9MICO|nr:universal stress protein [Microbacterium aurantiacum]MDN4462929.1 universal stress protein [Microbacterium aurantiacum]